jgi:hypothetical protein
MDSLAEVKNVVHIPAKSFRQISDVHFVERPKGHFRFIDVAGKILII